MPHCNVGKYRAKCETADEFKVVNPNDEEGIQIFYQRYGRGPTKVLLVIGLAGNHESWGPQVIGLAGTDVPNDEDLAESGSRGIDESLKTCTTSTTISSSVCVEEDNREDNLRENGKRQHEEQGIEVCTFDNRGVGKSSIPLPKSQYTTEKMAEDALALLDHLGWEKAHVCGHSMGGMIACKLAAIAPHRLSSLSLIGVTGGGYQCLPKLNWRTISLAYRLYRAKTPEARSAVDLETHYTHEYLETVVGEEKRRALLLKDYVTNLVTGGMQPRYGLEGQVSACWNHSLDSDELERIRSAGIIVALIHGRDDAIAQIEHARNLANKLEPVSRIIELSGGHLVTHSNTDEVNGILHGVIRAVKMNVKCSELKAGDPGLYNISGGDPWQAGNRSQSSEGVAQAQEPADRSSQPAAWGSARFSTIRNMVPEWLDTLYVFPSLHWATKTLGIHKIWRRMVV